MSGSDLERRSLYPDPEECSRNFSVAPRVTGQGGGFLAPALAAAPLPPAPTAAAAATFPANGDDSENEDDEEEDTPAASASAPATTTTTTDETPGGLPHRVRMRDREARSNSITDAVDASRATRWVCYVRGCAVSASGANKREIGRHWGRGAHAGLPEAQHDPSKVFGVEYADWLRDEGLRATWEATTRGEFEELLGQQEEGEDDEDEDGDDDEEMQE